MARPTKPPRVNDRDWDILQHVLRYRITTREILHDLFFSDSEPNAATKVTSRLCESGLLNRYDLMAQRSYFVLGSTAAKLLGMSRFKCAPLGPQALVREYGTMAFCFNVRPPRERLTVSEIARIDPAILGKGLDSSHYYIDRFQSPETEQATNRLSFIRVDHGATPEHIVKKCIRDIACREKNKVLQSMIASDKFMISIATCTEQKKDAILLASRHHKWTIRFRIEVIPDLINLIGGVF